jgi:dihydrofolate synthase/folylpolyglutamate synthase
VGLDHCETLGNTLQEIASNKAGIIKPNKPAVIGFNAKPYDVFINQAK